MVDASVAVKWLASEPFSNEAAALLKSGATLVAPELMFAEVVNALWTMRRRGDITAEDLGEAVDALKTAPVAIPFSMAQLAAAAAQLAIDIGHPAYDCFYLALAIQTGYPVVTADIRFHDKVRAHPYLSDRIRHIAQLAPTPPAAQGWGSR